MSAKLNESFSKIILIANAKYLFNPDFSVEIL